MPNDEVIEVGVVMTLLFFGIFAVDDVAIVDVVIVVDVFVVIVVEEDDNVAVVVEIEDVSKRQDELDEFFKQALSGSFLYLTKIVFSCK